MRRILITALSTASALVLLLSYRTSTEVVRPAPPQVAASASGQTETDVSAGSVGSATSGSPEAADSTDAESSGADTPAPDASGATTYIGEAIPVAFGTLQVEIEVVDGAITRATAIDYPYTDPRDIQLNGEAIPALEASTLEAQSADIDLVTGATFTSQGYIDSLQSALDEAGL